MIFNLGDIVIYQNTIWRIDDIVDSLDRAFLEHITNCAIKVDAQINSLILIT